MLSFDYNYKSITEPIPKEIVLKTKKSCEAVILKKLAEKQQKKQHKGEKTQQVGYKKIIDAKYRKRGGVYYIVKKYVVFFSSYLHFG